MPWSHLTPDQRFFTKVDLSRGMSACWEWIGYRGPAGYGEFWWDPAHEEVHAHRFAYEHFVGSIPAGLQIDHLCRNRGCVNPMHMEAVTIRTNLLRGNGAPARNARKTECLRGHPLSGANLYLSPSGSRTCRACQRMFGRQKRS